VEGGFGRIRRAASALASIAIAGAIAWCAVAVHRALPTGAPLTAGAAPPASPALAMTGAATILEQKTALGGAGFTFEIVQRSTMHAKPGGPLIDIPDPNDRHKSLGLTDTYELGSLIERGSTTPAGFTMEMRTGPAAGKDPDWSAAYQFGVIATGGKVFRNDGDGWYKTNSPPGIGLDPATAALLPSLLRNATNPANSGFSKVGDVLLPTVSATGSVADFPGVVAADGATFTNLVAPVEFTFDDQGRLALLHSVAQNTNLAQYDLLVDTLITFGYPAVAPALPDPTPTRPETTKVVP
jgi:hypothetical protein